VARRPYVDARGLAAAALDERVKLGGMNEFHAAASVSETRVVVQAQSATDVGQAIIIPRVKPVGDIPPQTLASAPFGERLLRRLLCLVAGNLTLVRDRPKR